MGFLDIAAKIRAGIDEQFCRHEAILQNDELILESVKEQMRLGKSGEEYKSDTYADMKAKLPTYMANYPKVDLYLTGSYQNQMFIEATGGKMITNSKDEKAEDLDKRFVTYPLTETIDKFNVPVCQSYARNCLKEMGI